MNRREFFKKSSLAALSASVLMNQSCNRSFTKPNIIFLLTDDQRWDTLGCMGNKIIQTPNLDNLANTGTLFSNAFVTTSICMTSRASILTGQYANRHQINDFSLDFTDEQFAQTYPALLKKNGYSIGFIGKYGVGSNKHADNFDFWKGIKGQPVYEITNENGESQHLTSLMGDQALEFLNQQNGEEPFCLSISFKAPHVQDTDPRQFIYDPALKNMYSDIDIPIPPTANNDSKEKLPGFMKDEKAMARKRWQNRYSNPKLYQEMVKGYYRLISGVDIVVGRIREQLVKQNLDKNTVIVFIGDNGFYLGEKGLAGKWFGHEESIRVPLIINDPRVSDKNKSIVRKELALNIDIAPTILDFAGVDIPEQIQGQSLKAFSDGKSPEWRQEFFYEHHFKVPEQSVPQWGYIPSSIGVRTERYKYLRYYDQNPVYEELFDLENDPREENNLAFDSNFASILEKLRKRCNELNEETK